jgi:hypothetical protein
VYGQKVNASGIALWDSNGVRVGMSTSPQGDPYVASDGSGGAIFEWGESRGDTSLIYAQHIDAGGARQWSSEGLRIASGQAGRSTGGIVSDGGGGAVMAWIDERSWDGLSDLNSDVYAQRVSGSGEILWTANGIAVCTQPDIQSYAQLVSDGAGGAIIGWTDQRNKGFVHTYGQHISSTGVPTWTSDGIPFNAAESDQSSFSLINTMCSDGLGGAIVTWADGRNDVGGDIFAQKLSGNLTFAGYRTFSPLGIAIAHDQRGRLGVSVKPNKGMPNEINVLEEIFRQGIFPDNPSGDALGGIVIGLSYLHTQNGVLRVDPAMAKTHGWMRLGRWDNRLMHGSRSQDVLKTLSTRGVIQNGVARGFEFVHERSALPPAKYNNALMAQQIALKLNILVSACGMAKPGFGELRYVEPGSNCTGRLVREIAGTIDSALTLPDPSWDYSDLLTVSQKLNHAFEGPMDVIPAGYPIRLALRGVHNIADVPILVEDAGVKPRIVTPQSGSLTEAPVEFALYQNYPNPFNPLTTIEFSLPDPSIVTMKVYNTLGQEVTTLIDQEEMSAGTQAVQFDASGISSGVYFYRVNATAIDENGAHLQRYNVVKKMLVVK